MELFNVLLFLCGFSTSSALFSDPVYMDLDEINLVQYDIKIGDSPIVVEKPGQLNSPQADILVIPMTNKKGQKYQCSVPNHGERDKANIEAKNSELDKDDGGEQADEEKVEITGSAKARKLLEPMTSQPCLLRTKDWWTYEFCYGRTIKQFHLEDGKPSGPVMVLGFYDHDENLDDDDYSNKNTENMGRLRRHHAQIYTNGSKCDLTGQLRRTEVRFECDPTSVVDVLSQVDEPQSCEYIITIKTSKICAIPQLRPPPVKKPLKIECQPVLTVEEHEKYQKYLKNKEKSAHKKAEEMQSQQKINLLKALEDEDISHIDVDSEEGLSLIEGMVGEKLADKLVGELGAFLGTKIPHKKWMTNSGVVGKPIEVQEHKMANGEMQSHIVSTKNQEFNTMLKDLSKAQKRRTTVNTDPRSELSDETEMMDDLVESVKQLGKDEMAKLKDLKKSLVETAEESLEEIVAETEGEMNVKLDGLERHQAIEELHNTLQELMSKLDKAEADISKVNEEIEHLHGTIDDKEEALHSLKKELLDNQGEIGKEEEEGEEDQDADQSKVNIKVTNYTPSSGLTDSPSDKRVIKHLERAIKKRLNKAGLDTGGRQIEVKFISTSIPTDVFGKASVDTNSAFGDESMTPEEAKQFQGMIYNLMIGNQEAYDDIDTQRKAEKSYQFAVDDFDTDEESREENLPDQDNTKDDFVEEEALG